MSAAYDAGVRGANGNSLLMQWMRVPRSPMGPLQWLFVVAFRWFLRALFTGFGSLRVVGIERVPWNTALLYAPNHKSLADPWLIFAANPRLARYVAARELHEIKGLGWFISLFLSEPVGRNSADHEAIARTRRYLEAGDTVVIFPEGRCSPGEQFLPVQAGVAVLALQTGTPIVPVSIRGSNAMAPLGSFRLRRHSVTVEFGEPIYPACRKAGMSIRQEVARLQAAIAESWSAMASPG